MKKADLIVLAVILAICGVALSFKTCADTVYVPKDCTKDIGYDKCWRV